MLLWIESECRNKRPIWSFKLEDVLGQTARSAADIHQEAFQEISMICVALFDHTGGRFRNSTKKEEHSKYTAVFAVRSPATTCPLAGEPACNATATSPGRPQNCE